MILIAHRGNTEGPKLDLENSPEYVDAAIESGFDVEVDLWVQKNKLHFGHDSPDYLITKDYLLDRENYLWVHCKNGKALETCLHLEMHCFFHVSDEYTLTSSGYVWGYPGSDIVGQDFISVMPEWDNVTSFSGVAGICSDYVRNYV